MAEKQLEAPTGWSKVPDLMMGTGEKVDSTNTAEKRKINEVVHGHRKGQKEDEIRAEKREHSTAVQKRTSNPAGFYFYSEDWEKLQQEEDDWQVPDKWQRISQIVFCCGVPYIHLACTGYKSGC